LRRFEIVLPETVEECLRVLGERGGEAKLVAGGTDLLPQLKNGLLKPGTVVDLSAVAPLKSLQADKSGLRVGAAVSARAWSWTSGCVEATRRWRRAGR
jgi:carbon-monoxide dehydrogenase medium subunit